MSDLPELTTHLLELACARVGVRPKELDPQALQLLMTFGWEKNNVRELRNVLERMVIAAAGARLEPEHVPAEIRGAALMPAREDAPRTLKELKAETERQIVVLALQRNNWHISNTARALGLADHSSLIKIMRRHKLSRE